jgi:hypothetical protein
MKTKFIILHPYKNEDNPMVIENKMQTIENHITALLMIVKQIINNEK